MKLLLETFITAGLVLLIAGFMSGVYVSGFAIALIVAVVLGLLNAFVKPILILFTLPVTLFTFGLFLLVINAIIILLCAKIVNGFKVDSFWTALIFSIILSVLQSIVHLILREDE